MRKTWMLVLLLAGCASGSGRIDVRCSPLCVRDATVFEDLRGRARASMDAPLFFCVSPDEEWVAVFQTEGGGVKATHVPTSRMSRAAFHYGWWADCFSPDGRELYMGKEAARLVPGVDELVFRPRTTVGGGTSLAGRKTSQQAALQALGAASGKVKGVDLTPVFEIDQLRDPPRRFQKIVLILGSPPRDHDSYLEDLSLSPDGKLVAGIARIHGSVSYGVVIPLDQGPLVARPFARNLVGRFAWSRDSRRIWFYARPDGSMDGTVYRVDVKSVLRGRP